MSYWIICGLVFFLTYLLNMTYVSVFYHRGLTHRAITLRPWLRWWVSITGVWVTGLDPKGWACMHRIHHAESDKKRDPHSPLNLGIFGVFLGQLRYYERCLIALMSGKSRYEAVVADLEFKIHWLFRYKVWFVPYLIHLGVAVAVSYFSSMPFLGVAYFTGLMGHPVQGWLVNAFGHSKGYRNFRLGDNSHNNTLVAWFVFGEGFQNNHHRYPVSPKFSVKWWEFDFGYLVARVLRFFGLISFEIPNFEDEVQVSPFGIPIPSPTKTQS